MRVELNCLIRSGLSFAAAFCIVACGSGDNSSSSSGNMQSPDMGDTVASMGPSERKPRKQLSEAEILASNLEKNGACMRAQRVGGVGSG